MQLVSIDIFIWRKCIACVKFILNTDSEQLWFSLHFAAKGKCVHRMWSQVWNSAGNTSGSHPPAMTLDTRKWLALLQELLLALRANDAEGFKGWLALGLEELGRQVVLL